MTDIAQLGLAVDSSQVISATTALQQFATSAKPAADAAASLENASKGISTAMGAVAPAAMVAAGGTIAASDGMVKLAASARPAVVAMAELEATLQASVGDYRVMQVAQANGTTLNEANTGSLRSQRMVFRALSTDLAVFGTGMGQYAGLAGMMFVENEHMFAGFGNLKNAIVGLLTPQNLLIGGLAALVVGGYEAISSIVAQEKALDDLSHRTDETVQSLHGLETAAAFKGINAADFTKGMEQFQAQVEVTSSGLNTLFRANKVDDSGGLKDSLVSLGDLIKNAASEADKYKLIQEAGLPATRQWVDFLSQGSASIGTAANEMGALGSATDPFIQKAKDFDEKWNKSWRNFADYAKSAVIESGAWLDQLLPAMRTKLLAALSLTGGNSAAIVQQIIGENLLKSGQGTQLGANSNVDQFYKGMGHDGTATGPNGKPITPTVSAVDLKSSIQEYQQLLGLLGPLASADQLVTAKENDLTLAGLNHVSVTKQQHDAIIAYTAAQALGIVQIHSQTDALGVESATFAMTAGQAAAFNAVQTKINEQARLGNTYTPQQIALLQQTASALGDATERMDEMRSANEALSSAFKTFRTDMENGTSGWTALKDAAMTALNSIADKLIDMASKNLVAAAFGGSSGSGSILGGILGLLGGKGSGGAVVDPVTGMHDGGMVGTDATFTRYVHPAHFNDAPRFHEGGITGDEVPIIAKAGEGVFTPGQMKALAPVGASPASAAPIVNVYQTNDFRGTDPSSMARINAALVQTKNQAVKESISGILALQKNAPGVARPS
jgi:hypothetical protein